MWATCYPELTVVSDRKHLEAKCSIYRSAGGETGRIFLPYETWMTWRDGVKQVTVLSCTYIYRCILLILRISNDLLIDPRDHLDFFVCQRLCKIFLKFHFFSREKQCVGEI